MKLTIEQALQQAIVAHKEGQLRQAEHLYRAILKSQSTHAHANHNLGVLAVSAQKTDEALPLFKRATEADPTIEQFWLSYIDALIKERQFDNASLVLEKAKTKGVAEEKLNALQSLITKFTQMIPNRTMSTIGQPLPNKSKKMSEKQERQRVSKQTSTGNNPSQPQLAILLTHYQSGRLHEAEELASSLTKEFPTHQFAWKVLGATLDQLNKIPESARAKEKAVELDPNDTEALSNLGNTLRKLGRLNEAEAMYKRAITVAPGSAEAQSNLGVTLHELGKLNEAEECYQQAIALKPEHPEAHNNLGITLHELGKLNEAEASYKQAIALKTDYAEAYSNLGTLFKEMNRLNDAEVNCNQAIALKPDYAEAHSNLGITLKELGKLDQAETICRRAIALKPDYAEAHSNLGVTLHELGRLAEAETSYKQAIALKPDYSEAHNNLGVTLHELGKLNEAETSYKQAIALNSEYVEAHCNLGVTLEDLGRLDEAEASYNQAIAVKPDHAQAHYGLSKIFCSRGYEDLGLKSIIKAHEIEPKSKDYEVMLRIMEARKIRKKKEAWADDATTNGALIGLISNPLMLDRLVETELINIIYDLSSVQLDKTKRVGLLASGRTDARYGNGLVSPDFKLFDDIHPAVQKVAKDLKDIMRESVKADVYVYDSFFNILKAGGGTTPHAHLRNLDRNIALGIGKQKYSLVYYLSVGDQNCSEPGILKLYDPSEDILPHDGMILIIPASRRHSAVYSGSTDRVMIGANFYSL